MNPSIEVRVAQPDEWHTAGELAVQAYAAGGHAKEDAGYLEVVRDVADRVNPGPVLVALVDNRIVGTVTICPPGSKHGEIGEPSELEFRYLAVDPEYWGTGVAQALVDTVLQYSIQDGAHRLVCCVISWNDAAHGLYERNGFIRAPHRDWAPVPGVDLWAYERRL